MNNQTSIKYITSLLERPETIAEGDSSSIALFRQTFPYFVPTRYLVALESHKKSPYTPKMLGAIQPYLGDWILFCDFLQNGSRSATEQLSAANKVVDKRMADHHGPQEPSVLNTPALPVQKKPEPQAKTPLAKPAAPAPKPESETPPFDFGPVIGVVTERPEIPVINKAKEEEPIAPAPPALVVPDVVEEKNQAIPGPVPVVEIPVIYAPPALVVAEVVEEVKQTIPEPLPVAELPPVFAPPAPVIPDITEEVKQTIPGPLPVAEIPVAFTPAAPVIQEVVEEVKQAIPEPVHIAEAPVFATPVPTIPLLIEVVKETIPEPLPAAEIPDAALPALPVAEDISAEVNEQIRFTIPQPVVIREEPIAPPPVILGIPKVLEAPAPLTEAPTSPPTAQAGIKPEPVTELPAAASIVAEDPFLLDPRLVEDDDTPTIAETDPGIFKAPAESSQFAQAWAEMESHATEPEVTEPETEEAVEIVNQSPPETVDTTPGHKGHDTLIFPIYTKDYFLQQGEKISEEIPLEISELKDATDPLSEEDKSLMVVMSFSEWLLHFKNSAEKQVEETKDQKALKTMWQKEKLAAAMEEENEEIPENVFEMAVNSINKEEGLVSETLADIYIKQGKYDKAIEMYRKLSLKNPQKNVYFARKIEEALKDKQS